MDVILKPRERGIEDCIDLYAEGKIPFSGTNSLCSMVAAMGYKTTSLYEMTRHITPKKDTP